MTAGSLDSAARDERVNEAIADYLDAVHAGQVPDEQEFLRQHTDVAADLRQFLANRKQFQQLADSLGPISSNALQVAGQPTLAGFSVTDDGEATPLQGATLRYFGDYVLLEQIARGGMGVIYKARQESLNRVVAVKLILAGELASEDDVKRFYSEAKVAASLHHPNIVAIHEVGQHQGQHYFSMDYVRGTSLAEQIRRQPLSTEDAVQYVKTIAEAIHYAHQQGTLHRDLKPSNILIDEQNQPRITDFGLAKQVSGDSDLTATGQILGTPNYMPPEQAMAKPSLIGPPSDVYSLGAVLYELLTGRPPFVGGTAIETLLQVRQAEVVTPRLLNPYVPRDLETICLKCLDKEPHRRYATAAQLAEDLDRYLTDEPILARPLSLPVRAWKWCRRKPLVATLYTVVMLAFFVVMSQWMRAEYHRLREVQARIAAVKAKARADHEAIRAANLALRAENLARSSQSHALAAEKARKQRERSLYIARMTLATQAVDQGNFRRASSLLEKYGPHTSLQYLRGFEWHYLWRRVNHTGALTVLHGQRVYAVDVTSDGRWLVTGGRDGTAKLWDLESGQLEGVFKGHEGYVACLAISPDGEKLCTGSNDHTIKLWDMESRQPLATIASHEQDVRGVAFSTDGKLIASAGWDHTVRIHAADGGKEIAVYRDHTNAVFAVAFSPDGKSLVSTSLDQTIRLWNLESGKSVLTINKPRGQRAYAIAISPDGKTIASGSSDDGGSVELWDLETGEKKAQFTGHLGFVDAVAFSPDGTTLASGSFDQTVRLWDVATGEQREIFRGHAGYVRAVRFLPGGSSIVTGSFDGMAKVWRLGDDKNLSTAVDRGALATAWSPDGQTVAVGTWGFGVYLIDTATGQLQHTLEGHTGTVYRTTFSGDGKLVASASRDKTVRVWDVETGMLQHTFEGHTSAVRCLAIAPDGTTVVSADEQGEIALWNIENGQLIQSHQHTDEDGKPHPISALVFSPNGQALALIGRFVTMLDLPTGESRRIGSRSDSGYAIAFSPQGNLIATADREESVWLWSLAGKRKLALSGHVHRIECIAFSPDGKIVATGSRDHTIKLWDVQTGEERTTLTGHANIVNSLAFSPDGGTLVSGSTDRTVRFWRAATETDVVAFRSQPITIKAELFHLQNPIERARNEIHRLGGEFTPGGAGQPALQVQLTSSEVSDQTLATLVSLEELQQLQLFNTSVTSEGLKQLSECKSLVQLELIGNTVNDDWLAGLQQFPRLTTLVAGMGIQPKSPDPSAQPVANSITDSGLIHLSRLTGLTHLTLDNTRVTDKGLKHLTGLTQLRRLQLFRTPAVTDQGLDNLRTLLPACKVENY